MKWPALTPLKFLHTAIKSLFRLPTSDPSGLHEGMDQFLSKTSDIKNHGYFLLAFAASLSLCAAVPRMLSFLPGLTGTVFVFYYYLRFKIAPGFDRPLFLFLAGLCGLATLSTVWSPDPAYSFERALKILPLFISGFLLLGLCRTTIANGRWVNLSTRLLTSVFVLVCLFLFLEYRWDYGITKYFLNLPEGERAPAPVSSGFLLNRNAVYLVFLTPPLLLLVAKSDHAARTKIIVRLLIMFSLAMALCWSQSQSAQIAAAVMAASFCVPWYKKAFRYAFLGMLLLAVVLMPLLPGPMLKYVLGFPTVDAMGSFMREASIPHRLEVWNFAADEIAQKPLLGHGIDAMRFLKAPQIMPHMKSDTVLHPHNAILQIWLEFGFVGIILIAAFLIHVFKRLDDLPTLSQKYFMMLIIGFFALLSIGYGLWQAWQIGMIMAITGFSIMAINLKVFR